MFLLYWVYFMFFSLFSSSVQHFVSAVECFINDDDDTDGLSFHVSVRNITPTSCSQRHLYDLVRVKAVLGFGGSVKTIQSAASQTLHKKTWSAVLHAKSINSMRCNFIYKAPVHNSSHLELFYTVRSYQRESQKLLQ